ncbi:MAG: hypothetical protein ACM31O_21950 [Bacteroidota bacterium]
MTEGPWPWLALAALGAFHGLNPAMGWLFAVALGLHRRSRRAVWLSLIPIALGHALAVAAAAAVLIGLGVVLDLRLLRAGGGIALIAWALYQWRYGHRHRVRTGMQTAMVGLAAWSFLMATAHGAGLMLWPMLMPLCLPAGAPPGTLPAAAAAFAGVAVHTLAALVVTGAVAVTVYEWVGVEVLRYAWLNVDRVWTLALLAAGLWLLLSA